MHERQDYLTENNTSWCRDHLRCTLYKKAQENRKTLDVEVERLAEESGQEVLWLPPYHSTLNPIELMWGVTKNYISSQFSLTSLSGQALKEKICDGFQKCTKDVWQGAVKHCRRVQVEYVDFDKVYVDRKGNLKPLPDPDELMTTDPASTTHLVAQ